MNRIDQAAIKRLADGRIWTGKRHSHIIHAIVSTGHALSVRPPEFQQGFVTCEGTFVDRKEALDIAVRCGQLKNGATPRLILTSEDIY